MSIMLILVIVFGILRVASSLRSPCPELFQYESTGGYKHGVFSWKNVEVGQTLEVKMRLLVPGRLPTNYYGELSLLEGKHKSLQNIINKKPVMYKVDFPAQNLVPSVSEIRVNGQLVCYGEPQKNGELTTKVELNHTMQTLSSSDLNAFGRDPPANGNPIPPSDKDHTTNKPPPPPPTPKPPNPKPPKENTNRDTSDICGTSVAIPTPLVVGGETIRRGAWPWLVAVYLNNPKSLSFRCGGTLISSKTVISAAHCFKLNGVEHNENNIVIMVGRHNLLKWNEKGSFTVGVQKISIHPDYKDDLSNFDGDVAVIVLKQTIKYSQFIRPVCLWRDSTDVRDIEGMEGITVGWGRDENGRDVTPEPKKVSATIVSDSRCFLSNKNFVQISSNRTFCAGMQDGNGPCTGDSGGGLMINRNNRWYIRGTVSGSLLESNRRECDLKQYVVYSDIAKFMSWIVSNMES